MTAPKKNRLSAARVENFARSVEADREDTQERLAGLRLQARAWRITALIALVEPAWAKATCTWLFFHTAPYIDEEALTEFINDNEERARQAGLKAKVFDT